MYIIIKNIIITFCNDVLWFYIFVFLILMFSVKAHLDSSLFCSVLFLLKNDLCVMRWWMTQDEILIRSLWSGSGGFQYFLLVINKFNILLVIIWLSFLEGRSTLPQPVLPVSPQLCILFKKNVTVKLPVMYCILMVIITHFEP